MVPVVSGWLATQVVLRGKVPEVIARWGSGGVARVSQEGEARNGMGLELGEARRRSIRGHLPTAWIPIRAAGREVGGVGHSEGRPRVLSPAQAPSLKHPHTHTHTLDTHTDPHTSKPTTSRRGLWAKQGPRCHRTGLGTRPLCSPEAWLKVKWWVTPHKGQGWWWDWGVRQGGRMSCILKHQEWTQEV